MVQGMKSAINFQQEYYSFPICILQRLLLKVGSSYYETA